MPENPALELDTFLGEVRHENEEELFRQIAGLDAESIAFDASERTSKAIQSNTPPPKFPAMRDVHPKQNGCVEAEFQVVDDLRSDLSQGVFKPGRKYRAVIRFSNGNPNPTRADAKPDARGMAIKLFDVEGARIFSDEKGAKTQDFVMINHPVFFVDDPARYLKLTKATADRSPEGQKRRAFLKKHESLAEHVLAPILFLSTVGFKSALAVKKMTSSIIASPIQTRYWSMSAYRLGEGEDRQAVKFSAWPSPGQKAKEVAMPAQASPDFLHDALMRQLGSDGWQFDFGVQPRVSDKMSVENTRVEWSEKEAPFIKVATITIPKKIKDLDDFGEGLSFSPWHGLRAHRPLGVVNRMRRVVYEATANARCQKNGVPPGQPTRIP